MRKLIKKLKKYKSERESNKHSESLNYRQGYITAMNDAINMLNKSEKDIKKIIIDGFGLFLFEEYGEQLISGSIEDFLKND